MNATLVAGMLTGLTYALLAIGLVLVYQTAGFLNLAHAQLGVVGALLLAKLALDGGWSYWLAFPVGIATGVGVGVLAELLVVRRVRARRLSLLLVSLGMAQILLAVTYVEWLQPNRGRLATRGYPVPFAVRWHLGGFVLRGQHVLILVLVPVLGATLAGFLAWTKLGREVRAVACDLEEARLCGISAGRVRATVWGIAGGLSAVTAILQAPSQGSFSLPSLGPSLLLRALGAAAIGGFTSLPLTAAGGVALGLVEHVTLHLSGQGGVAELAVLGCVIGALVIRSRTADVLGMHHDDEVADVPALALTPRLARRSLIRHERVYLGFVGLAVGVLAPLWPIFRAENKRFLLALIVIFALLAVSLTALMGWAGQVSLGHFALLGLGAYTTARLEPHGVSLPVILVAAGGLGAAVMVVVGLPAVRLPGLVLSITTLGYALVAPEWLYVQHWFGASGTVTARPPGLAGIGRPASELGVYYVSLAVLVLATVCLGALRRSTAGHVITAVRDNERDAVTLGYNASRVKLGLLAVSGFVAAAAGVLWISAWRTVSPELLAPESSFVVLAAPVVGGVGSLSGAIVGTVYVYAPGFFLATSLRAVFGHSIGMTLLVSGVGLVAVQVWLPGGMAAAARRSWGSFLGRLDHSLALTEQSDV